MSHASEVAAAPDEMIEFIGENDHAEYYALGRKVTVSWMPGYRLSLCLTCRSNECEHTRRVAKWRETRQP